MARGSGTLSQVCPLCDLPAWKRVWYHRPSSRVDTDKGSTQTQRPRQKQMFQEGPSGGVTLESMAPLHADLGRRGQPPHRVQAPSPVHLSTRTRGAPPQHPWRRQAEKRARCWAPERPPRCWVGGEGGCSPGSRPASGEASNTRRQGTGLRPRTRNRQPLSTSRNHEATRRGYRHKLNEKRTPAHGESDRFHLDSQRQGAPGPLREAQPSPGPTSRGTARTTTTACVSFPQRSVSTFRFLQLLREVWKGLMLPE